MALACQAGSVSRSKVTACPPSSDVGVSVSTARGAKTVALGGFEGSKRTKGSRIIAGRDL